MESTITENPRYTHGAIALHWIIAALIIANYVVVNVAEGASEAEERELMGLHFSIGLSVLIFSVLRIIWRITHPRPPFDPSLKGWEVLLARVTHGLFYFLMIALPFAGWALVSSHGAPGIGVFGLFDMPGLPIANTEANQDLFHELHEMFAGAMFFLFLLHVLAALKHQFVNKDTTMSRMIPFLRRN